MSASAEKIKLNSHVYFCVLFTILSYTLLPMVASFAGILSGQSALREIEQNPEIYYGKKMAKIGIYASYASATIWLSMILMYVASSFKSVSLLS